MSERREVENEHKIGKVSNADLNVFVTAARETTSNWGTEPDRNTRPGLPRLQRWRGQVRLLLH